MAFQLNNLRTIRAQLSLRAAERHNNKAIAAIAAGQQTRFVSKIDPEEFNLVQVVRIDDKDLFPSDGYRLFHEYGPRETPMTANK